MPLLSKALRCAAPVLLGILFVTPLHGEVFKLRKGGRVVGQLLNPNESPRQKYVIKLYGGGQMVLANGEVRSRIQSRPQEEHYETYRAKAPDTVDGHWKLAQWCLKNHLGTQRQSHLRRVIELEPDHEGARRGLGYEKIEGEWQIRREYMERQGLFWFRGRYRSKQEIEIIQREDREKKNRNKWIGKLKRYSQQLSGSEYQKGKEAILAINDPLAVDALNTYLVKDDRREAKRLYIQALTRIDTAAAIQALYYCAIRDDDEEIRLSCLDHLKKEKRPKVVSYFIETLRNSNNAFVNRAAVGLAFMEDPSAIRPLIDALITVHTRTVTIGKPGGVGAGFGNGGVGLNVGARRVTKRTEKENQAVLDALVTLTGGYNFGFNQRKWRNWYAKQHKREPVDARRD